MNYFHYIKDKLYCEEVDLARIAEQVGTPCYVYSYRTLTEHFLKLKRAFASIEPLICFSMKCNSNLTILNSLVRKGAGLDIVSGGELFRALKSGCDPQKIVYAGVGKTEREIKEALKKNILLFNVESKPELDMISQVATRLRVTARISIRVNPDVDAQTHEYITTAKAENKFGIDLEFAEKIYVQSRYVKNVSIVGVHIHIGSQIVKSAPFVKAIKKVLDFCDRLKKKGVIIKYLNLGGGLGIIYKNEKPQTADEYAKHILPLLEKKDMKVIFEPGRFIMGNSGVFLTSVLYYKKGLNKNFVIIDGAMNDLMRPSLYGAYHEIVPLVHSGKAKKSLADVVGPICESGDFLGKDRKLPELCADDLLAVMSAGAYGFSMSSNYNSRPRVAEVLVSGKQYAVIRKRETYDDLIRGEEIPAVKT